MFTKATLSVGASLLITLGFVGTDFEDQIADFIKLGKEGSKTSGPISSQPIALSEDGKLMAVANTDNNSVSLFRVADRSASKIAEVGVQEEPTGVAISPDGKEVYSANTVSGTVSVIRINRTNEAKPGGVARVIRHIPVGVEPVSLVLSPSGKRLYVANARSNSISVINTRSMRVVKTIDNIGFEPRGLTITNDADGSDDNETLYVTQFLALPAPGRIDGEDNAKEGRVTMISLRDDSVTGAVVLNPLADTGFKAAGDAVARIAPPAAPVEADFKFTTGAYFNQLNNLAIKGDYIYLPATGASPNGPVRFDVNTQSLLGVINRRTNLDANKTINMHVAVKEQTSTPKLFITQPWAIAFKNRADEGYVISAASNILVKVKIDPTTGAPTVQRDPQDNTRVLQLKTGKNPRGIVINRDDTRAFVMNYISRDVTMIDISGAREQVIATISSANLPVAGTFEDKVQAGKELYNTSVGEFDPVTPGGPAITGRMSNNGWGSCASCHPNGLTDNVVWIFPAGPRRTISQHTDFDTNDPARNAMRVLNWSANRDEEEDFELNIRAVSGGQGLIVTAGSATQEPNVVDLTPVASGNRNQLKIRGFGAWDAIKAYEQFGIRAPQSPIDKNDPDVIEGAQLFREAKCQTCHGGTHWTSSLVNFTPPVAAAGVSAGQVTAQLKKVGTFDPALKTEIRQNAAAPLGADGFVPPSLLSIFAFQQTFNHNGAADSLEQVLFNVTHRSAGTNGVDILNKNEDRNKIVKFLKSIDARTPPIPIQ
jgi:YVTN family beta-propeller protein